MKDFDSLDLIEPLRRAVAAQNYRKPTPIQAQSIPPLLAGRDLLGCAQTGTGKTAAFSLPVLQQLAGRPTGKGSGRPVIRALILSPTRELATQIAESFEAYGAFMKVRQAVIFGGVNEKPQIKALQRGVDVVVACPGRLLDLLGRGYVDLSKVEYFVLDEADRMLDMGFINDIRKIMRELPKRRQNLLFSATMPKAIVELADSFLHDPVQVSIAPKEPTVDRIDQSIRFVRKGDKRHLLEEILGGPEVDRSIVFTRTKHGANRLVKQLDRSGFKAVALHGNKSQNARRRALDGFRDGDVRVLVATDVASRGIDVDEVTHVVNYDLPNEPESYVHRIGRTGRAGRSGIAVSFCDESEGDYLRDIEKLIGQSIEVVEDHEWHFAEAVPPPASAKRSSSRRGNSRRGNSRRGNSRRGNSRRGNSGRGKSGGGSQNSPKQGGSQGESPKSGGEGAPRRRRRRRNKPSND